MKRILLILSAIWLLAVGAIFWILTDEGFFRQVAVTRQLAGPYTLICQPMTGDYGKSGMLMDEMYAWLKSQGITPSRGFGFYFDDPRKVKKTKLRSVVGNLLEAPDLGMQVRVEAKYPVKAFPATDSLCAEVPFKSRISVFAGTMKAYPALYAYARNNHITPGPVLELYDMASRKILYVMPIGISDLDKRYYQE